MFFECGLGVWVSCGGWWDGWGGMGGGGDVINLSVFLTTLYNFQHIFHLIANPGDFTLHASIKCVKTKDLLHIEYSRAWTGYE